MTIQSHLDVSPEQLMIVRSIVRKHVPESAVWAFGSRTTGRAKPFSDLDLAIISETPLPLTVSAALAEDFSESDLPWKVDVVDWAVINDDFRKVISRNKIVIR